MTLFSLLIFWHSLVGLGLIRCTQSFWQIKWNWTGAAGEKHYTTVHISPERSPSLCNTPFCRYGEMYNRWVAEHAKVRRSGALTCLCRRQSRCTGDWQLHRRTPSGELQKETWNNFSLVTQQERIDRLARSPKRHFCHRESQCFKLFSSKLFTILPQFYSIRLQCRWNIILRRHEVVTLHNVVSTK